MSILGGSSAIERDSCFGGPLNHLVRFSGYIMVCIGELDQPTISEQCYFSSSTSSASLYFSCLVLTGRCTYNVKQTCPYSSTSMRDNNVACVKTNSNTC